MLMCLLLGNDFLFSDARCCRYGGAPVHVAASSCHLSCLIRLVVRYGEVDAGYE